MADRAPGFVTQTTGQPRAGAGARSRERQDPGIDFEIRRAAHSTHSSRHPASGEPFTGVDGHNRLVKTIERTACGFRMPGENPSPDPLSLHPDLLYSGPDQMTDSTLLGNRRSADRAESPIAQLEQPSVWSLLARRREHHEPFAVPFLETVFEHRPVNFLE